MNTLVASNPTATVADTLYLTQILVTYEDAVRLLRIRDTYDWHQRVWQAFGGCDGATRDFLVRVDRKEEAYRVLILSRTAPRKTRLVPDQLFWHQDHSRRLLRP